MVTEAELTSLSERIVGAAFKVSNTLGTGFLEKVYENALTVELRKVKLQVQQQVPIAVLYEGIVVGEYAPDLLVNNLIIVEVKAVRALDDVDRAQCMNYLKATNRPLALLLNFGSTKVEVKRVAKFTQESLRALGVLQQ